VSFINNLVIARLPEFSDMPPNHRTGHAGTGLAEAAGLQ